MAASHDPGSGKNGRFVRDATTKSMIPPDANRTVENVAGSTTPSRSAMRHRIEFAAKATRAITVYAIVRRRSAIRRAGALVVDDGVRFDLDEPVGVDEADDLHDGVGPADVPEAIAVHGCDPMPLV